MQVKTIPDLLEQFRGVGANLNDLSFEYSEPWYFNKEKAGYVPFSDCTGLYIYTGVSENLDADIFHCDTEVLYVGKSQGGIGGRVWAHMGVLYDPETKEVCNGEWEK